MTRPTDDLPRLPLVVRAVERTIFASRWLLAPFYFGLGITLLLLLVEFARSLFQLIVGITGSGHAEIIVGILSLVDLSLVANLVLMVMFAGYENFVSRLDASDRSDRPDWMGEVGYGDLKLKLMSSIVAISAILVLESFMNLSNISDRDLAWTAGLHAVFIVSAVLLAVMERISHK